MQDYTPKSFLSQIQLGSSTEFLGLKEKQDDIMAVKSDERAPQETIEVEASLVSENGAPFHNHILHCEFGLDSTKASNKAQNETPQRRNQGKRLKIEKHAVNQILKVCDEIASSIRTKLGALVEVQELIVRHQDNVVYFNDDILHSKKTKSIEQQKLSSDEDDVVCWNESIQNSLTDFEDHINGVEMFLLEHRANIDILNYRDSDVGSPSYVSFVGSSDDEEEDDEEEDVSASQDYDLYTKALVDFSSQVMEGLHINDISNQNALFASKEKLDPPKKRQTQPKVDKAKYGALDKFISAMHLIQGDRQLSPWNGLVVDSVVSVLLTQNVCDGLSSQVFMNLASKFPALSDGASDSAIHNSELLRIAEGLSDEVHSKQLSIVAKDSIYCPSSQTQVDPEDGNANSSQTESTWSTSEERKGKDTEKQVTKHWDELRGKYCTKNRTDYNRDSVNWEEVRKSTYQDLAKMIMKRGSNYLLSGFS
ncbi:demeter-like protein 3 [Phtheirospermum japonicum]|uniref:Demeter-like protein 3 n=1 Tax=Phtheirospermum japonicum TaxID=374723 RepID=A0A830CUX7_9LAMI|nr:demeter-like protein 3 [Phtheirospermum japonicum]